MGLSTLSIDGSYCLDMKTTSRAFIVVLALLFTQGCDSEGTDEYGNERGFDELPSEVQIYEIDDDGVQYNRSSSYSTWLNRCEGTRFQVITTEGAKWTYDSPWPVQQYGPINYRATQYFYDDDDGLLEQWGVEVPPDLEQYLAWGFEIDGIELSSYTRTDTREHTPTVGVSISHAYFNYGTTLRTPFSGATLKFYLAECGLVELPGELTPL